MALISNGTPPSPKRPRRTYGDWELDRLETVFLDNSYPDREQRNNLAKEMNVSPKNIQIWFQNRRARARLLRRKAIGIVENPIERMRLHWIKTPPTSRTTETICNNERNPIINDENKPPSNWNSFRPFQKLDSGHSIPSNRQYRPVQMINANQVLLQDQSSSEDSRPRTEENFGTVMMTSCKREPTDFGVGSEVVSSTNGQCPISMSNLSDISNSSFVDLQELDFDQPDVFSEAIMTIFSPNVHSTFNFE